MTDQRTLKRIITEQRAEIQKLQKEYDKTIQLLKEQGEKCNDYIDSLEKQVEAAKTILNDIPIVQLSMKDIAKLNNWLHRLEEVFSEGFSAEKSSLSLKYQKEA